MTAFLNNGGVSAPPTVLPFPQSRVKRRRMRRGMEAAGFLSLLLLERDGDALPENVQRFDEPEGASLPERTPALLLALAVFGALPKAQRATVKRIVRGLAYDADADPSAVQLNNALSGRR